MRRKSKNIVLENIKLVSAGAKGVAVGRTDEGKPFWFPELFRVMW